MKCVLKVSLPFPNLNHTLTSFCLCLCFSSPKVCHPFIQDFINSRSKAISSVNHNNNSYHTINKETGHAGEPPQLKPRPPSLIRSPSISKLVNSFESIEKEEDIYRRNCAEIVATAGFRGPTQLNSSLRPPKPPPLSAKPILRHTVRLVLGISLNS